MLGDSPLAAGYGWGSTYPGSRARRALQGLAPILAEADVVFGNLEVQLSHYGEGRSRMERNSMRGHPEYAAFLRELGFNVVAVANNHAMQHGDRAFNDSVEVLRSAGIQVAGLRGTAGWHAEPVRRTALTGSTIGILAYSLRPRQYGQGTPSYADGPEAAILEDTKRLASEVDHVAVSLHWGEEFAMQPSASEVAFAHRLCEAGADVIIGHHPHVARPVARHGTSCIAYSLGNAVSDMTWQPQFRAGLALRCELGSGANRIGIAHLNTDHSYLPSTDGRWDYAAAAENVEGLPEPDYAMAVEESMRSYRRAALRHMALKIWRSPVEVAAELVRVKARNLAARISSRITA